MPRTPASNNWCFTLNNPTKGDLEDYQKKCTYTTPSGTKNVRYFLAAVEGRKPGKTRHFQGMVQFMDPHTFTQVKKWLGKRAHFQKMQGTAQQAQDYCLKGDKISKEDWHKYGKDHNDYGQDLEIAHEHGQICLGQGQRSDLKRVCDAIREGTEKVDNIILEDPDMYHQYGRTLHACEDLYMLDQYRTEAPQCYWLYGKTGVGKSHRAWHFDGEFRPKDVYNAVDDRGWFDGYKQQKVFLINEFRGEIKFSELLQIADRWPYSLRRRNRMPIPFTSPVVIITSCKRPEDIYHNVLDDGEHIDQLYRRFTVVEVSNQDAGWDEIKALGGVVLPPQGTSGTEEP